MEAMKKIKVFYAYAREDGELRDRLEKHFKPLKQQGYISEWYDQAIQAGALWEKEINAHLSTADIILLLVSPDFIDFDDHRSGEMGQALKRHKAGDCRIVPIILRPVLWELTFLSKLRVLPEDEKPIVLWGDQDEAMKDVAKGLSEIVTTLLVKRGDPDAIYKRVTGTKPTFIDQLDEQTSRHWSERDNIFFFENGAYHVCVQGHNVSWGAFAQSTDLSDFMFQVEMTLLEGSGGGMTLRDGYTFNFNRYGFNCAYGETVFVSRSGPAAELNRSYVLTAIVRGNSFSFYVDEYYLDTVTDSRMSSGKIGLIAYNATEQDQTHVIYCKAKVWDLTNNSYL